jgi:hypothetical protein
LTIEKECKLFKKMHTEVSLTYKSYHSLFGISAVILTPMSGFVTAIGSLVSNDFDDIRAIAISSSVLSFMSGILITISKFSKFNEFK